MAEKTKDAAAAGRARAGEAGARGGAKPNAAKREAGEGRARSGASQQMIDLAFLRGLIEAVDQSGIDSLDITRAGTRIRIAKTPPAASPAAGPAQVYAAAAPYPVVQAPESQPQVRQAGPPRESAAVETSPSATETVGPELTEVKSPMVGTFYRSPAPEAPPYVEVGSHVTKGQTLCILEAMKLMNELESEVDGIVREVLAENGDPVEYGQVLFRIEPTKGA